MSSKYKGWYHNTESNTVIVFIHGLFSNSEKCWSNTKHNIFWPDLVKNDARFGNPNIFMAEFYTDISSGDYKVTDCSNEIHSSMSIKDEESGLSVLDKKNIIFVGHSTGGIVIRHLLESKQDLFIEKNIGIALYASPSFGSKLATSLFILSRIFNNKLAQELQWGSILLEDLDDRFRNLLESNKLNIMGFEAFENKAPFRFMPKVVNKQSAGRYFSAPINIANTNHSSIVKPISKSEASHENLVLFIQKNSCHFIEKIKNKKTIIPLSSLQNEDEGVLFEFYNPRNEKYYIERELDKDIAQVMVNNHIWLCGPTGIGKTVALQRAIYKSNIQFKYISLGTCINESIEYMLVDILSYLSPDHEIKEESAGYYIKTITTILKSHCANCGPLILFIEEIPIINQEMFNKFSKIIYSIIINMKSVNKFKLILSSIYQPADISGTEFEKITESFQIIKGEHWSKSDLIKLIKVIEKNININKGSNINDFEGSPRKTKIYYRNSLAKIRA